MYGPRVLAVIYIYQSLPVQYHVLLEGVCDDFEKASSS
jgi:hypothetical protein